MKILKILGIIIAVVLLIALVPPAFMGKDFHVERSIVIAKQPVEVYNYVADYGKRQSWDPWLELEPAAEVTVTGEAGSAGATYAWNGAEIGAGKMTTMQMEPGKSIKSKLEFIEPFQNECDVFWNFEPAEGGTKVTWGFDGQMGWPLNWMIGSIESGTGADYERGLNNLKKKIEG